MEPAPTHPIRLVVADDLERSRLTVFFRLLLAIPHLFVLVLWSTVAFVVAVINWFATLVKGQSPQGLHDFLANYLRYATQVEAYLLLAGNPFPPFFVGSRMTGYPIDLEVAAPAPQNRWKTLFRLFLALPAVLLAAVFLGGPIAWMSIEGGGVAGVAAILLWFSILARGRASRGLRDIAAWSVGYGAQVGAYLFLLTDRYPSTGPKAHLAGLEAPEVSERVPELVNNDDYRRSRLTVLLRLPLAFPHIVWLILWTIAAVLASIANWFSALAIGRSPRPLARFLAAYIRYATHVMAFLYVAGNPFPGFVGAAGSYPLDVRIDPVRPAEPLDHALPAAADDPGRPRVERGRRCRSRRGVPRLVRRARPRPYAGRAAGRDGVLARLLGAAVRVRVRAHGSLSPLEPTGGLCAAGARAADARIGNAGRIRLVA